MPTLRHLPRSIAVCLWDRSPFVRKILRQLVRLVMRDISVVPPPADTFRQADLASQTDKFNSANERYFATMTAEAKRRVGLKPYSDALQFGRYLHDVGLLVHHLRLTPGDIVLDFGAGTCWLSLLLNRFGCPTISLDVSASALEIGRAAFEGETNVQWELNPRFLVYDGHTVPLPDASVDRVIFYDAFHHIPNQTAIFHELARVLRPGGLIGMVEPGRRHSLSGTSQMEMDETGVLENDIVIEEVRERALDAGFSNVNIVIDALGAGFEIPADRLEAFVSGDWLEEYWARLTQQLVSGHIILVYRGDYMPTTRRPDLLRAEITPEAIHLVAAAGTPTPIRVSVANRGNTRFLAGPPGTYGSTFLGGHLHRDGDPRSLAYDWLWIPLPAALDPGETVQVEGELPAIDEPGKYRVVLDLVADKVTWFTHQGSSTVDLVLEVRGPV